MIVDATVLRDRSYLPAFLASAAARARKAAMVAWEGSFRFLFFLRRLGFVV